ncbi:hypothetical protein PAMP_021576 [Pampus punctatissimus]
MDEQAGPGVFFNNNGSGLPGGGNIKAPQSGDLGGGEAARAQYSIPGILHFLQHEWARFEVSRAQWEVERAELRPMGLETDFSCKSICSAAMLFECCAAHRQHVTVTSAELILCREEEEETEEAGTQDGRDYSEFFGLLRFCVSQLQCV